MDGEFFLSLLMDEPIQHNGYILESLLKKVV
jgi:hypothetical protein